MRFRVDENLSPRIAELLTRSGNDAVHVRDIQAASAPDSTVIELALRGGQVIISAETDFGALLAQARATKPSVILVREITDLRPKPFVETILEHLDLLESHLQRGASSASAKPTPDGTPDDRQVQRR